MEGGNEGGKENERGGGGEVERKEEDRGRKEWMEGINQKVDYKIK